MPDRRIIAMLVAATVVAGGIVGIAVGGENPSRQQVIAERGATVMPFSLDATTHVFNATATGGTQRVVADDPRDSEQIRLIRQHLHGEGAAFKRGDFADPATIHGRDMPGLTALERGYERIQVRHSDLADGAQITYRTADRALAEAVGAWFATQLRDHGADAAPAGHSGDDHSAHPGHGG